MTDSAEDRMESAIKAICKGGASSKIIKIFADEGIDTIDDIADLTVEDLQDMGIAAIHAKNIFRKCQQFKLKIAVGKRENVVGFVRVPRAYKLADLRAQIVRDELPVPDEFVFTEDGAAITRKQEDTWDVEIYESENVCVLEKLKRVERKREETEKIAKSASQHEVYDSPRIVTSEIVESPTSWAAIVAKPVNKRKRSPKIVYDDDSLLESQTQVYIGNLLSKHPTRKLSDEELLYDYIYKFGEVKDYNRPVGHYAFVAFAYPESAKACVEELDRLTIRSFRLVCRFAAQHRLHPTDNDVGSPPPTVRGKIALTDLPDGARAKDVLACFPSKSMSVVNVVIRPSQRLCHVMFESEEKAERATREEIYVKGTRVNVRILRSGNQKLEALGQADTESRLSEIIQSFFDNKIMLDTALQSLSSAIQSSADFSLLCDLLIKEGVRQPEKGIRLCEGVVSMNLIDVSTSELKTLSATFEQKTRDVLANVTKQFTVLGHTKTREHQIRDFLSFLVALHKVDIITSPLLLDSVDKLLEMTPFSAAFYGRSIKEALAPSTQKFKQEAPARYAILKSKLS